MLTLTINQLSLPRSNKFDEDTASGQAFYFLILRDGKTTADRADYQGSGKEEAKPVCEQ